ncbi:hypothetical protein QKC54_gp0066 [Megavirus baoshan]|uniref:Uncharacterized protein n=1 Tax=Megavirus baoshan TaxID=2496520 RepID=A0A3Q8U8L6_9VIRU|nr:hypothetical protein QKC54_gp0066 [Megavirus baoshan]AZL89841.1 hypothetical protein Mb1006 [Megavirus baoshan]
MDILGNVPSQYWIIVSSTFNNSIKIKFDYDSLKEIYSLEINYYNYIISHIKNNTFDSNKILKTLKILKEIYTKLHNYTNLNHYQKSIEYVDIEIQNWFKTNFHNGRITLDGKQIELLKYIYGREQCKFTHILVEQAHNHLKNECGDNGFIASWISYANSYLGGFYGKNAFEIISEIYESQKNEMVYKLKQITVNEVQPSDKIYKIWSILNIY